MESVLQLVTVLFIFVFVLAVTYFTTRWIAKNQKAQMNSKNIEVIETYKVTPNKYIQIIRTGNRFLAIAICKDTITMLTELSKDEVEESVCVERELKLPENFKDFLEKAKNNVLKK